ncbi:PQQ-binding-like beta-propeller repeat protein [Halorubellus litoreus]|uniref:PQQ-binding-like beta-propeller repeat protein n=1 Tax=Halorubellus litoreus TaxID=755308 RepID=A0ABD5V8M2_9EURY
MGSDRSPTASRRAVLQASGVLGLGVFGAQTASGVATADGSDGDATDAAASAWTQFGRGPSNAGTTDVDLRSEERPFLRQRWSRTETGQGIPGQPVVANGRTFTVGWGGTVRAFDVTTGVERWSADAPGRCVAAPAVANGVVYVVTTSVTAAYEMGNGTELWSVDRGGFAAPTVHDGTVYVPGASPGMGEYDDTFEPTAIAALSAADGSAEWTANADALLDTTPAVADGTVVVGTEAGVWALDPESGDTTWKTTISEGHSSTVTVADGVAYGQSDGTMYAIDVASGDVSWTRDIGSTPAPRAGSGINPPRWFADAVFSAAVRDGVVYATIHDPTDEYEDNSLYAFDAADGSTRWTSSGTPWETGGGHVLNAPTLANDEVYVLCQTSVDDENDDLFNAADPYVLLSLDPDDGTVAGTHVFLDNTGDAGSALQAFSPVTIVDDRLLFTTFIENGLPSAGLQAYRPLDEIDRAPPKEVTVEATGDPTKCTETTLTVDFPENLDHYDRHTVVRWTVDGDYRGTARGFYHGTEAAFDLAAGEHTASVTAVDRWGRSASASTEFTVAAECDPKTESVGIDVQTDDPMVGEPVEFRAVVEGDDDLTYEWDVACGSEIDATGREASYTFDEAGDWGIHLLATDEDEEKTFEAYTTVVVDDAG